MNSATIDRVRIDDIELAFWRRPHADPARPWLLFAHSLASDHTMWTPQLEAFAPDYALLACDLRGHGASSAPEGPYALTRLADDLAALLSALAIERCHVVGLSLGGMVGQCLALRHPARLRSLTLADTASHQPPGALALWSERIATVRAQGMAPMVEPTLARWFTPAFFARAPQTVAQIGAVIGRTPVAGYAGCAHAVATIDLARELPRIAAPTLVLTGREDASTPPPMAESIARAIPGARCVLIDAAAHLSNVEQPDAFNAVLREFLHTIDNPAGSRTSPGRGGGIAPNRWRGRRSISCDWRGPVLQGDRRGAP